MTREEWLTQAASVHLHKILENYSTPPPIRVSVGWPSTRPLSTRKRRLGECWPGKASKDGLHHVFITPLMDDGIEVLGVLVHELIHAAVGCEAKHRGPFKKVATAVGLVGKMTATTVGPELLPKLETALTALGPYPHAALNPQERPDKKQTTRMLKATCKCGYTVRLTRKWADVGMPSCPDGMPLVLEVPPEEGE